VKTFRKRRKLLLEVAKFRLARYERMALDNCHIRSGERLCFGDAFVYSTMRAEFGNAKVANRITIFVRFMLTFCGGSCEC
jgi:hypothetical protein